MVERLLEDIGPKFNVQNQEKKKKTKNIISGHIRLYKIQTLVSHEYLSEHSHDTSFMCCLWLGLFYNNSI